uniref:BPTI/Kunitz inhibitor domain-containing protein n=1 Tax=Laticauda laticaudata TaxID=8630 RepID=A0A8C5SDZ6_LATLA
MQCSHYSWEGNVFSLPLDHANNFSVSLRRTVCLILFFSVSHVSPEICNLPRKIGRCKASFLRFYFNTATGKCERFFYGGCGGNKNNFMSFCQLSHCERGWSVSLSLRFREVFSGSIFPIFAPMFILNCTLESECSIFSYDDLLGFLKRDSLFYFLLFTCISRDMSTSQSCRMVQTSFLHFYFNAVTGNCEKFFYGGCMGNENNFFTLGQCRGRGKNRWKIYDLDCMRKRR